MRYFALSLLLLNAHAGVVFTIANIGVAAWPVVHLPAVFGVPCRLALLGVEDCFGLLEIVVVCSEVSACDVFGIRPCVDKIFVVDMGCTISGIVGTGGRSVGQRAVAADVVSQHELVAAVAVLEVEVSPFHLHQARDEVEVGLSVLDHVVPAAVAAS